MMIVIMKTPGSYRLTPQSQKEKEGKEEEERYETYTKKHCDRRCQLKMDMAQKTVRLDEGEEEESEVTQEARRDGRRGERKGRDARTGG